MDNDQLEGDIAISMKESAKEECLIGNERKENWQKLILLLYKILTIIAALAAAVAIFLALYNSSCIFTKEYPEKSVNSLSSSKEKFQTMSDVKNGVLSDLSNARKLDDPCTLGFNTLCGGEGWTGPGCCGGALVCTYQSPSISRCLPVIPSPTSTSQTPSIAPTNTPTFSAMSPTASPLGVYEVTGIPSTSVTRTPTQTNTKKPSKDSSETNSTTSIPTPYPTSNGTLAPTSMPTNSTPTAFPTPKNCVNKRYGQCGGDGFTGDSCCKKNDACTFISPDLSICWPVNERVPCTPAPTIRPTSKEEFSSYIEQMAETLAIENDTMTQSSLIVVVISFLLVFASFLLVVRQRQKKINQKKRKGSKGSIFRPDGLNKKKNYFMDAPTSSKNDRNSVLLPTPIPPVDLEKAKKFEKEFGISKNIAKRTRWSIGRHIEFMQKHSAIRAGAEYIIPANEVKIVTTFKSIGQQASHKGLFAGSPVAIKEITLHDSTSDLSRHRQPKHLSSSNGKSDEDLFNSFLIDFQMLKYLQHPNIVQLFGVSSLDSKNRRLLLITELGEYSLRQVMASDSLRKLLTIPSILYIARSVAIACNFIHSKGVVHFNLKPENILLNHDVTSVKVSDLGLSQINRKRDAFLSGTDSRGLPVYVAPELINDPHQRTRQTRQTAVGSEERSVNASQLEEKSPADSSYTGSPRLGTDNVSPFIGEQTDTDAEDEGITSSSEVDVYSFGFILWEMFHAPYPCCPLEWDAYKVIIQTKFNNWRPKIDSQLPAIISTIITRCWDADPQKRPTMKQVIAMLDAADFQLGYDTDVDNEEDEDEEEGNDNNKEDGEQGKKDSANNRLVKLSIDEKDPTNSQNIKSSKVDIEAAENLTASNGDQNQTSSVAQVVDTLSNATSAAVARPPLPPRKTSGVVITNMLELKKKKQKDIGMPDNRANRPSCSEEL